MKKIFVLAICFISLSGCGTDSSVENNINENEIYNNMLVLYNTDKSNSEVENIEDGHSEIYTEDLLNSKEIVFDFTYQLKGNTADEFAFLIANNPIDAEYQRLCENYDGSSSKMIELSNIYKEWWYTEMEVAYAQLLNLVDKEDLQALKNSQETWEVYKKNKFELDKIFYIEDKYDTVGHLRKAFVYDDEARLVKERAYVLLEYLYIFEHEINFVFNVDE